MNIRSICAVVLLGLVCGVLSHSYVTSPVTRSNQVQTNTGCRGPQCRGPCDTVKSKASSSRLHTAKRGDTIAVKWPRNNHAAGFIRFSWAPFDSSDNADAFDANVQQYNCHENGGCHSDDPKNLNGGDSGPTDGSTRACSATVKVPATLDDGKWTLQWAWFGGIYELGDYYSCMDYQISGGTAVSNSNLTAVFYGGDVTYPGEQKCKFFNTDRLHRCIDEPCNNPLYTDDKAHSGAPYMANGNTPTPGTTKAATTKAATTKAATTKAATSAGTTGESTTDGSTTDDGTTGESTTSVVCVDTVICFDQTHTQRCYNNQMLPPQSCLADLVCKTSPSAQFSYCVKPTDEIQNDGSIVDGTDSPATFVYPTWISLALLAVYMLL